jgi:hypothetical protein
VVCFVWLWGFSGGIVELGRDMDLFRSFFDYNSSSSASSSSAASSSSTSSSMGYNYPSTGAPMTTTTTTTPTVSRKRGIMNLSKEEGETYEDFKLRILNLAINAGDCYKDLTPAFTEGGDDINEGASTTTGASSARGRNALSAEQKKKIFDQLLVYMFDLTDEVAMKTLSTDPIAAEKDALKRKVITFFYKNGFDVPPINDTNNVTTSIKNFVEENYFVCPKGRNFKYNLHMSEDDRQKFPQLGIDGINIIYDAAGVLPQNIFLPGSYEIICTPGSYIDPGTKIKNPQELPNVKTSKGIIPDSLRNAPYRYTIGSDILRKYGLSDIVTSIDISYEGLTKTEPRRPQESFQISFIVNTRDKARKDKKGKVGPITFNPTSIGSGFGFRERNSFYQHQIFNGVEDRAAEYFQGNAQKNKFIYENHARFMDENESDGIENEITNEFIKYIIMKELGDTLQVLWLDVITEDPSYIGASGKPITKENTFVMTGDAMLIARCILNGYNCIYLSGASSTFYLSNVAMATLPLLSEKLPELAANPMEGRMRKTPGPKVAPKTPGALGVVEEPYVGFVEDPINPALNEYLTHNYGVINSLITKGNMEGSLAGKNIWFYFAAYLKHYTDVMREVLRESGADAETIRMFHLNGLGEGGKGGFYRFRTADAHFQDVEETPKVIAVSDEKKLYKCFPNKYDVILKSEKKTGTYYYAGEYNELFERISGYMTLENKARFYTQYYSNEIKYPSELVSDITQTETIIKNFNQSNTLYNINSYDIQSSLHNVAYFLHKLQTESSDKDISIERTIGGLYCYFGEEETGLTPRKRGKQSGGAFEYMERPADYEFKTYRPYFANPGYATFYALSRFPRVFLMGYSIMRFLRNVLQAETNKINTLFKFCEDALDPQLSKLLTEVFLNADEPNYYYNVDSIVELKKQIERFATLDTYMYYTIEIIRDVSRESRLFAPGNEKLMETINGMLLGRSSVYEVIISPELKKVIIENGSLFIEVVTEFFRALIQNYNDLADVGKADMVNNISCYEHKIKNSVMSGVEEIMMPLEILIKERKHIKSYTPSTRERVDMSGFLRKNIGETENIVRGYLNRGGPIVTNVNTRAVSRGRKNIGKSVSGLFPKQAPRSEGRFTQGRIRPRFGRRGEGREPNGETTEELFANSNTWGGARPKTKKRTALKPKRTRRKERK